MKKTILTLALVSATALSAQIDLRNTRFGITAGGNYSRVSNAHNPSGPRYTMQAGALALIPIDNYEQFYIQPELLYYGAGESGNSKDDKSAKNAVYANNYLSVPIYFKGYFSEAESEFFGMAGPRFNFLVSQKVKNPSREWYTEETYGKANSFNFGAGVGIGYSYKRMLEVTLKYDIGISDTYPDLKDSPDNKTGDPNTQKKKLEQVFSIGLSYIFN
ncbi:porin family protein [Daejeonia sp. YH14]|uniref:porin family protein n=1 Tax=Daejeonia sp. YH14 TaxID=3439042 RepID=UPI003F497A12